MNRTAPRLMAGHFSAIFASLRKRRPEEVGEKRKLYERFLKFCNFLLSAFGAANLVSSIIGIAIFIVAIYGGYFLVTYICSKNIIKEK